MESGLKNSQGIGYSIRVTMNCDWRIITAACRTVAVRQITTADTNFRSCNDCGKDSNLFVVELTRFTPVGKRNKHPLVWGWCGYCDLDQTKHI